MIGASWFWSVGAHFVYLKKKKRVPHLRFHIYYRTGWGENLGIDYILLSGKKRGRVLLASQDGESWLGTLEVSSRTEIEYIYVVLDGNGDVIRKEPALRRTLKLGHRGYVLLSDVWTDRPLPSVLWSSAFTECVYKGCLPEEEVTAAYRLRLVAPPPPEGYRWGVSGGSSMLGNWRSDAVCLLVRTGVYEWSCSLNSCDFQNGTQYKYVLVDEKDPLRLIWEEGDNRRLPILKIEKNEAAMRTDDMPRLQLPAWRGAGVVIPVFSLRSRKSFGIGDFGDLKRFVTWAASTGMKAVQLLPVNDTTTSGTWKDSYPYSGISVFALHPIYLDMEEWRNTVSYARYVGRRDALNGLPEVDYEAVFEEKINFLHDLYEECAGQILKTKAFRNFCEENEYWLGAYTSFCERTAARIKKEDRKREDKCGKFYSFVQFLLHRQMQAAHEHARKLGVILKGDIPIGIGRNSVPAEAVPELFHFDGQAGAPPDAFARHGQNWGFPTYNWDEMQKDDYDWWRRRFRHMADYFDAYRIDHVLGFFRIWEIPYDHIYGLLGHFRPALPLTQEEIFKFGFTENVDELCRPRLTIGRLEELAEEVGGHGLMRFFYQREDGRYELRPEFDTQRKLMAALPEGPLRNILMDIVADILFIEDKELPRHYHPRIAAQETWRFGLLDEEQRRAFNRLYDDFFYVRHNAFWAEEAMKKLPSVVGESPLLPCAEDLGMVPPGVPEVLRHMNILTLEIQRMPKRYGVRFDDLGQNPWLSVTTIATHDMPPLRLWWQEDRERAQEYWHTVLKRSGPAPMDATPDLCEQVVSDHLASPSMLCLLGLQDFFSIDAAFCRPDPKEEQINDPANPEQYWCYRMHVTIEDLMSATAFNEKLRGLIRRSGR